jgi:hypothetical protein
MTGRLRAGLSARPVAAGTTRNLGRTKTRVCVLGMATLLLAGCNATTSDVGGGKLTATGCRSRVLVGDELRVRVQWTATKVAKYTLVRLDGVGNFRVNGVFDETLSRAKSNGVSDEYDLPGPATPRATKRVVAVITARKAGNSTMIVSVWGSGNLISEPPNDVASISCAVAVNP